MADKTGIEWTDATWNPVVGCSKVSPGCANCYAEGVARRFADHGYAAPWKPWTPANASHNVILKPERLELPLRWKRPRLVFVNSMSDLFHPQVPDDYIERVFDIMAQASQHTFQVLTKRPKRMAAFTQRYYDCDACIGSLGPCRHCEPHRNIWLGTSVENNRHAGRADHLRATVAGVRFISAEPLLGPLDKLDLHDIDWLIAGGESGHGARPMHPDWPRALRDRCAAAGVAFHFKQWGAWVSPEQFDMAGYDDVLENERGHVVFERHIPVGGGHIRSENPEIVWRVGKGKAGRTLDGRTHDEMPPVEATVAAS